MAFLTRQLLFIIALLFVFAASSTHARDCAPSLVAIIEAMYAQGLNRSPDSSGLLSNFANLVRGKNVKDSFSAIVRSPEYKRKFVDGKSEYFVVANLYKTVLSRCPEKRGFLNYVELLQRDGKDAYIRVIKIFFDSDEYNSKFGVIVVPNPKPPGVCPGRPF